MPGLYSSMIPFDIGVAGALTTGVKAPRVVIPFAYEVEGVTASVGTAPTGANLILDVMVGANNTAPGSLASMFSVDNTKRPVIVAGAFDNQSTSGPDQPAVTGDTATEPSFTQFLARPTAPSSTRFAGNQPVGTSQPASFTINPTETTPQQNQPQEAPNVRWGGNSGDALQVNVVQIGSTVAGSDLLVTVWVVEK